MEICIVKSKKAKPFTITNFLYASQTPHFSVFSFQFSHRKSLYFRIFCYLCGPKQALMGSWL